MAGLLSRALRNPALLGALGVGGAAGLSAEDEEDALLRALLGAAVGGAGGLGLSAAGRGVRGLLGRVPTQQITPQDKIAQTIAARRALGQTGGQATQFPSRQAMDELDKYGDMVAMEKYGDRIGRSGVERAIEGIDEIGRLGTRVWDGIDAAASRAAPVDRMRDIGRAAVPLAGAGAIGGAAYTIMELVNSGDRARDAETRAKLLTTLGLDPTPTGLMMFQAQNGIQPTGEWDEQTIVAIASALQKAQQGQSGGPPAPSLAPHNQR